MAYRIVGVENQRIVIEFKKNKEELCFDSYQNAQEYLDYIISKDIVPTRFKLEIKK